jgi:hypothetical protein
MSWKPDLSLSWLKTRPAWLRPHRREKPAALARRQAGLISLAATQRVELAELHAGIQASSLWVETGLSVARSIRSHPQAILMSLLAASMTFGKGMSQARSWTLRGLALHQLYRMMGSGLLQMFRRKPEAAPPH